MSSPLFFGAFVTGLLGSGHCLGMCGGIVAAFSLSGPRRTGPVFHLLYNAGRIGTYSLLGALVGYLGLAFLFGDVIRSAARFLTVAADVFVILVGVGSALALGHLNLMKLEFPAPLRMLSAGARILSRLPPAAGALPLGAVFGLLPCGLVYAVLITAAVSGSPAEGALTMAGFGLGTAPALLAFGSTAHMLGSRVRGWMLRGAGVSVALMGVYALVRHLSATGCH